MKHFKELKKIIDDYSRVKESMTHLQAQTKMIELQKNQIELELAKIKEAERRLIDKIVEETGSEPDFYELLQKLNTYEQNA
jgi:predicted  nucleic acid-binding Zn-ribbon protein